MIPKDGEFDVIVSEGVLVEVWRGPNVHIAQQFGADWNGPIHSCLTPDVFESKPSPVAVSACSDAAPCPCRHLLRDVLISIAVGVLVLCGLLLWRWL
jgi:hypothetical protein